MTQMAAHTKPKVSLGVELTVNCSLISYHTSKKSPKVQNTATNGETGRAGSSSGVCFEFTPAGFLYHFWERALWKKRIAVQPGKWHPKSTARDFKANPLHPLEGQPVDLRCSQSGVRPTSRTLAETVPCLGEPLTKHEIGQNNGKIWKNLTRYTSAVSTHGAHKNGPHHPMQENLGNGCKTL